MSSFNVKVKKEVQLTQSHTFSVGDTVSFEYTDVSSKTVQEKKGAVVGFWEGYPVVQEDEWTHNGTSYQLRLFRLQPDDGIVKICSSEYVSEHPRKQNGLAWASKYRKSDRNPRERSDEWSVSWRKRGEKLSSFQFGVELDNPSRPSTRLKGVQINIR